MDFSLTPEEEAFKKEVNDWLDENMKDLPDWYVRNDGSGPEPESDESLAFSREWHKKLYAAGFVGIAWPKEYGGRGASLMEQVIFNEEMAKRRGKSAARTPGQQMDRGWFGVSWSVQFGSQAYPPTMAARRPATLHIGHGGKEARFTPPLGGLRRDPKV